MKHFCGKKEAEKWLLDLPEDQFLFFANLSFEISLQNFGSNTAHFSKFQENFNLEKESEINKICDENKKFLEDVHSNNLKKTKEKDDDIERLNKRKEELDAQIHTLQKGLDDSAENSRKKVAEELQKAKVKSENEHQNLENKIKDLTDNQTQLVATEVAKEKTLFDRIIVNLENEKRNMRKEVELEMEEKLNKKDQEIEEQRNQARIQGVLLEELRTEKKEFQDAVKDQLTRKKKSVGRYLREEFLNF
jgi:hypothetical protein